MLLVGLAGLWFGTEATIRGAVAVAERLGIPEFVVGIAILSIGSDLPELSIAIDASIKNIKATDASGVVVGSALGSGLGQIGLVLGICGLFGYLTMPREVVYQQGTALLGSLILLGLVAFDGYVSRTEGITLIVIYTVYLLQVVSGAVTIESGGGGWWSTRLASAAIYLAVGLAIVIGSANLTVSSALQVADTLNVEQSIVAVIIIGLGTSLPELTISVGAILKRRPDLALGNVIGSNVFDTLVPIGVAASITKLEFHADLLRHELPFLFALTLMVLLFLLRKSGIQKRQAITIIAVYVLYVAYRVLKVF